MMAAAKAQISNHRNGQRVMPAFTKDDGALVWLKVFDSQSQGLAMLRELVSDRLRNDTANHTIPIHSFIPLDEKVIVVESCWSTEWPATVSSIDILDLAKQLLEVGIAKERRRR